MTSVFAYRVERYLRFQVPTGSSGIFLPVETDEGHQRLLYPTSHLLSTSEVILAVIPADPRSSLAHLPPCQTDRLLCFLEKSSLERSSL